MPSEDIIIDVSVQISEALANLGSLADKVNVVKQTVDGGVSPSINNLGTKLTGAGEKAKSFGAKINNFLGNESVQAFKRAGDAALSFSKQCIDSAIASEQAWTRFGGLVNSNGGDWNAQKADIKGWAKEVSNSTGRSVGEIREASAAFLEMGVSIDTMKLATNAASGVAARAGITETEAADVVRSALLGKGRQLEKLTGLRIDDYKNAEGQIDKERLLNDIYNQNKGAIEDYANTTEGQMNKIENSWNSFKTSIGNALLPVVKIIADVATQVADWFANLPEPAKQFIAVLLVIGSAIGVALGALTALAPILTTVGGILVGLGEAGSIAAFIGPTLAGVGGGFTVILSAVAPLIAPILAIVAAFAALYFVGTQLGWWNDLSGMISKFGEVLGQVVGVISEFVGWFVKLFTDFPAAQKQFQDFINGLSGYVMDGLGALAGALEQLFWDAVNAAGAGIMGALGSIGTIITDALSNLGASVVPGGGLVEGVLALVAPLPMALYSAFVQFGPQVVPAVMTLVNAIIDAFTGIGESILSGISSIPGLLLQYFMNGLMIISQFLNQARMVAGMLVMMLVQAVVQRFLSLVFGVRNVFMMVVNAIRTRLNQARAIASMLASMVRQVIVTRFNQLIARVRTIFTTIVSTIRQRLSNAASAARTKAQEILQGIKDKVAQIPDKVKEEFDKIKDRISSALDSAKQVAVSKINDLVAAVKGALGIASPGFIQRMAAYEFESIPGIIEDSGVDAIRNATNMAQGLTSAWNSNIGLDSAVAQFDAFNPARMGVVGADMQRMGVPGTGQMMTSNTTTNNDDHTTINNYYNFDCSKLAGSDKEMFYNVLNELYPGGA